MSKALKHALLAVALFLSAAAFEVAARADTGNEPEIEVGNRLLESLKTEHLDSAAVKSVERRVEAIKDAKTLAVHKLDAITKSASAKRKSPLLYTAPSPMQLLNQIRGLYCDSGIRWDGLDDGQIGILRSYLSAVLMDADIAVIEAYKRAAAADLDLKGRSKAENYLVAYICGAHDSASYDSVLTLLADELPGDFSPSVLVESTLGALGSPKAAWQAFVAVDEAGEWKENERQRLLTLLIDKAKGAKEYNVAANAYRDLAKQDGKPGEEAQMDLIKMLADNAEDFKSAIAECRTYLSRFSSSDRAIQVEFLNTLYHYKAGQYSAALADAEAFGKKHVGSVHLPNVIMLQGLSALALGDSPAAVATFGDFLKSHPGHALAAKAVYMKGVAHLTSRNYGEAEEAFQRVIDFYPEDPIVVRARQFVGKLATPTESRQ